MVLKRGLVDVNELPNMTTVFGRRRKVAVRVYGEILRTRSDKDEHLPLVLESLIVGPHAFKRTENQRFEELDSLVLEHVDSIPRADLEPLRVHDIGASDGRTSSEFYSKLLANLAVDFTASDLYRTIHLVEPDQGTWWFAFDEERHLVQYGWRNFVLSPFLPDNPWLYPVNGLVALWLRRRFLAKAERCLAGLDLAEIPDLETTRFGDLRVTNIALVCRECRELMKRDDPFRFVRHDVREPSSEQYHLIRALNVFNQLDREGQVEAMRNCHGALHEGGLLVVGRSIDPGGETRASIWRRKGAALVLVDDLAGGAEVKPLVPEALASCESSESSNRLKYGPE